MAQKSDGAAVTKPSEKAKPSAARSLQSVTRKNADDNEPKGSKKTKSKKTKQPTKKQTKKLSKKKKTSKKLVEPFDDPDIGPVFRTPPSERDDLRNIEGLGPKFQDKLNELGIYRYSQVAKWTAKISAEIADRIGAGPRIKNEKWVQQAKQLSKKSSKR